MKKLQDMTLQEKIGQMIMAGFTSTIVDESLTELITKYHIGNVIFFARNLEEEEQIKRVCADIQELSEASNQIPAFISIDQEGGVVTRLPGDENNIPGAMLIAATGNDDFAYQAGKVTGRQLKSLGINMDLAPSVDVNCNSQNPVIGVRSYSSDPDMVTKYANRMIEGLMEEQVFAVAKHFPGHGDTAVDSHLGIPKIDKTLEELEQVELVPFYGAIKHGVPGIMSSHILFSKLTKSDKPATINPDILTGLLRKKMNFKGLILTDCMEMDAMAKFYGTPNAAKMAVEAGAQIICISHSADKVIEACGLIEEAVKNGEITMEQIDTAVEQILQAKQIYCQPAKEVRSLEELQKELRKLNKEIVSQGITLIGMNPLPDLSLLNRNEITMAGSYAYRSTLASSDTDKRLNFALYIAEKRHCDSIVTSVNPTLEEIQNAMVTTKDAKVVIYGMYNGHLNQGQIELAKKWEEMGKTVIAVTLRNPYDLMELPDNIYKLAAYEYDQKVFDGLDEILFEGKTPQGKLPVR